MKRVQLPSWLLLLPILCSTLGAADTQGPPPISSSKALAPQSIITVKVNGLTCSTSLGTGAFGASSYTWGASNTSTPGGGGGGGAGVTSIQALSVQRMLDGCSPALFAAVATGKHFSSVVLTQQDLDNNVLLTITLTDALVSSWSIGGSAADAVPTESVAFNFVKVCVAEPSSGANFCYDQATGKVS